MGNSSSGSVRAMRRLSPLSMRATGEMVLRHVRRLVGEDAAAEDVVQEAFLRVWEKAAQWERRGSARGWVYRIATNLSLNLLESRRRAGPRMRVFTADDQDAEDILSRVADSPATRPEAVMERADRIRLVRETVERLSEGKRRVMNVYLNEAETQREIARRLDLPLGTVKSRFHYASRELRELLESLEEQEGTHGAQHA